jgi:glutamate dehydrogenase (NAD(P)+)
MKIMPTARIPALGRCVQALNRLDYPEKLQSLLLTPRREMSVELVVQVGSATDSLSAYR